jgi:hypothetical protein
MIMPNDENEKEEENSLLFSDASLIIAIISASFIALWAIYSKAYFLQLSIPHQFFDLSYIQAPYILRIITLINLPILLILLIFLFQIKRIKQENLEDFRDFSFLSIFIIIIFLLIAYWSFPNLYSIIRSIAVWIKELATQNYIFIIIEMLITLSLVYRYIENKKNYKQMIQIYTSSRGFL